MSRRIRCPPSLRVLPSIEVLTMSFFEIFLLAIWIIPIACIVVLYVRRVVLGLPSTRRTEIYEFQAPKHFTEKNKASLQNQEINYFDPDQSYSPEASYSNLLEPRTADTAPDKMAHLHEKKTLFLN